MNESLREIFSEITFPPETISPVEWCEKHVEEIPYSPIPGRFRSENTPMIRDVMDAIASPMVRCVSVVACVQSGKSLAPELTLAYLIANAPGPALWLDVTDDNAKGKSENRLRPLFENCAPVKSLFNADRNKMRNSTMIFTNGMTLWILGANNRKNLQSRSIRYVFGDETWLWERGRMKEAEARTTAFARGKSVFFSQAGFDGDDTDLKFRSTDAREWSFRCPRCGEVQAFAFENLLWDGAAKNSESGAWDLERVRASARLVCPHCGEVFWNSAETRRLLNSTARFVRTNPSAPSTQVGFHWNALATMDWGELAAEFLSARKSASRGNTLALQTFRQQRLALPWQEDEAEQELTRTIVNEGRFRLGDAWSEEGFFDESSGEILPAGTDGAAGTLPKLRFMATDVQADYFYWTVRGWSARGDSRLLACGMAQSFDELESIRSRWGVPPVFFFIDCGYNTPRVLRFCAEHDFTALRGDSRNEWSFRGENAKRFYSPRERVDCGNGLFARRHFYSNLRMKDILQELRSGRTIATWEIPENAPAHYLKMLSSERRNNEKQIWEQIGHRPNHFFDCEVMSVAGAVMLGLFE